MMTITREIHAVTLSNVQYKLDSSLLWLDVDVGKKKAYSTCEHRVQLEICLLALCGLYAEISSK